MRPRTLPVMMLSVCMLLLIGIAPAMAAAPAPAAKASKPAAKPVIAVFTLQGEITESSLGEDFPLFGQMPQSLKELLTRMKKAGDDENVKAVVLFLEASQIGYGQSEEIRQAIASIRAKGKDVYAHS